MINIIKIKILNHVRNNNCSATHARYENLNMAAAAAVGFSTPSFLGASSRHSLIYTKFKTVFLTCKLSSLKRLHFKLQLDLCFTCIAIFRRAESKRTERERTPRDSAWPLCACSKCYACWKFCCLQLRTRAWESQGKAALC